MPDPAAPSGRYTRVAMLMHWLLAAALLWQLTLGWGLSDVARGTPERTVVVNFHKSVGLTLGILVLLRLGWRLKHPAPPLPAHIGTPLRRLAALNHGLLYACMLLLPLTGYLASNFSRFGVRYFDLVRLPPWGPDDRQVYALFNGAHVALTYVFCALVAIHLAAALLHAVRGDGVLGRMLPARRGAAARSRLIPHSFHRGVGLEQGAGQRLQAARRGDGPLVPFIPERGSAEGRPMSAAPIRQIGRLALVCAFTATALPWPHDAAAQRRAAADLMEAAVTIDAATIEIELRAPAVAMLGFSHRPKSQDELETADALHKALVRPPTLLTPNAAARCELGTLLLDDRALQPAGEATPGPPTSMVSMKYQFECANPAALSTLELTVFEQFPRIQRVRVDIESGARHDRRDARRPVQVIPLN